MVKLLGWKVMSFKGEDGATVEGTKFFCSDDAPSEGQTGASCFSFFLSKAKAVDAVCGEKLHEGAVLALEYNRYGKVSKLTVGK